MDPLVGLGILRDSSSRKITFRLFPVSVELKSGFSFVLSVSGDEQIRKGMIENKLAKENIEGNCEQHRKIKSSKEQHKCDKSNFLTRPMIKQRIRWTLPLVNR